MSAIQADHELALLRRALNDDTAQFRPGQAEAIRALTQLRERLLVVERTGWGKSVVYFLSTRLLRDRGAGPTLIVSPLLALMRNQITAGERLDVRCLSINSTNRDTWPDLMGQIRDDQVDALLVSPERFANDDFVTDVLLPIADRIGLLVVDEAHCISDWGHDFRPDYRRLVNVIKRMPPNMPVLGTTATANNRVIADIREQLGQIRVQRGPLMRASLALQTLRLPDQSARLAWLAQYIPQLPGTGIVYVLTRPDAEQVAEWLRSRGIEAFAYHSDARAEGFASSDAYRQHLEQRFMRNELKVLVATSALGMGYDKPDVGFVVHYQAPGSIVSYYQQVGRAGRAVDHAVGILMCGREDEAIQAYFRTSAFPPESAVTAILDALAGSDGMTGAQLESVLNLTRGQIEKVLKLLSVENPAPVIRHERRWALTPMRWAGFDRDRITHLTQQRELEWAELQDFVDSTDCLMVHLARALDDPGPARCGRCARCLGRALIPVAVGNELVHVAGRFLRTAETVLECRKQLSPGAFPQYGFAGRLQVDLRAEPGRVLSRWGDAGWGKMVADDKHANHFRDDLLVAMTEMIRDRWRPQPAAAWVACIPSQRHPDLVPDFARRLAVRLGLPFVAAIAKIRDNRPQKEQQNGQHRCRNLDGVFAIRQPIPVGPVLLVDDVIDSAWTLTVAAALLRQAGAQCVHPVALATTGHGD